MTTSSANPQLLSQYATTGLEMVGQLRPKANQVSETVSALAGSGSRHVPALGDSHTQFVDLVGDWHHLDEFAGDVARGFVQAGGGNGVVTVSDADLARLGQVGFADRDEAIRAAESAQQQLDELLNTPPDDLSPQDLQTLFDLIARGQFDPAFAVTFSESVGVHGYVDAMTLIQNVCDTTEGQYRVTEQGLGFAALLGTTLTTALDTVYQDDDEYRDPENAALAGGDRLDYGFIEDLASGYRGENYSYNVNGRPDNPEDAVFVRYTDAFELDRNLSVLLSYTDAPTWVAVDIGNGRLSPLLDAYSPDTGSGPNALVWGDRSGIVTNYADLLERNPDASSLWLYGEVDGLSRGNIELVLERTTGRDQDGGASLAQIVENGLTNPDVHESVPGAPSYVEGGLMREALLERAIDYTGQIGEIRNGHLHPAFAAGVDANMHVIDERINEPFGDYGVGEAPDDVIERYRFTHDFLRETMENPDAALSIQQSVYEYGLQEAGDLPTDPDERVSRLTQLGRIQGMATEAYTNAGVGGVVNDMLNESPFGPTPGSLTNFGLGFVPGVGSVNEVAQAMGISVGDGVNWLVDEQILPSDYDRLSAAEQQAAAQRATDQINRAIWTATGLYDTPEGADLRASAQGQPFVNDDGSIKTTMTPEEAQAFREWAVDAIGSDNDPGAIYDEENHIQAGGGDVQTGDTDVRGRRGN